MSIYYTDAYKLQFLLTRGWRAKLLEDTNLWMMLDGEGYPVTGGEHETADAALNEAMAEYPL